MIARTGAERSYDALVNALARVRFWLAVFVVGLVLSGVTAFPLQAETDLLVRLLHGLPAPDALVRWAERARGHRANQRTVPVHGLWDGLAGVCPPGDRDRVLGADP